MFRKLLVANRGEIACRVFGTASRMGMRTVAVYSDADRQSRHVRLADEACRIGPPAPSDSYLNGQAILDAAMSARVDAIHPGYGFLSENADFARSVRESGLEFVGPSAEAIEKMGLKATAKRIMEDAGVPVVPGSRGEDISFEELKDCACEIGFPVLIKAIAGGGGRGMRIARGIKDFQAAFDAARSEARTAFGDDRVLVERLVRYPRHVEIQVLGDKFGNVVHLFERDCSIQRRYQKLIEESPAPGMPGEMREALGSMAVAAARAIDYVGAGTVEFIAEASNRLSAREAWFMEMNTRLQVEHPVTESITGLDLVEWQLRIAAGERLPFGQSAIPRRGHAIEARLCAERVHAGFLPSAGRIERFRIPQSVRVDTGVSEGDAVSLHYDSLLAKLIASGDSREEALRILAKALARAEIRGIETNRHLLSRIAGNKSFIEGSFSTDFLNTEHENLLNAGAPDAGTIALAALGAEGFCGRQPRHSCFTIWSKLSRRVEIQDADIRHEALITPLGHGRYIVETCGEKLRITLDGDQIWFGTRKDHREVFVDGKRIIVRSDHEWEFRHCDVAPLNEQTTSADAGPVTSPMPGVVKDIRYKVGEAVRRGDVIAVIEAMKMEHAVQAGRAGCIVKLHTRRGEQVALNAPIATLGESGK